LQPKGVTLKRMDSGTWTSEWPRCALLLELALRYTTTGRTHGCGKLTARLEESRARMTGAPMLVHSLLSELCYVSWLLHRGDLATARHHALEAKRKARQVEDLLRWQRCLEARERGSALRRHSQQIQEKIHNLLARSDRLLARSRELQRRTSPSLEPADLRVARA
jgi:hypothetical protein